MTEMQLTNWMMISMNKRKVLLGFSALLLILYLVCMNSGRTMNVYSVLGISAYMNVPVISREELNEKTIGKKQNVLEKGLFYNYASVPLDIEKQRIYIYQNLEKEHWEGDFSLDKVFREKGYKCYFLKDDLFYDKKTAIKEGHTFTLYIIGEDYYKLDVVFSGLGIISITKQYELPKEEIDYFDDPDVFVFQKEIDCIGEVTVLAGKEDFSNQIIQGYVKYHIKGATSVNYPKKGYTMTFIDEGGKDVSLPLLGMDSYPKWKLNALWLDDTLIREKSAIDIWNLINKNDENVDDGSFQGRYVEFICDGVYQGVYLLIEVLDEEKLGLDYNDILYKTVSWDLVTPEDIDEVAGYGWKVAVPYRIRFPKNIVDYHTAWAPIKDYTNVFFGNDDVSGTMLQQRVDIENLIDLNVLLEICSLKDNNYKNLYISAHVNEDGTYVMTHHPWDMDMSFDYAVGSGINRDQNITKKYTMPVYDAIVKENPDVEKLFKEAYTRYRTTILEDEKIFSILNENCEKLKMSGAYQRNFEIWEKGDAGMVTDTISFLRDRLKYLDNIYLQ